mmetsp:Transcript_85978/g.199910  ORF Transcript_85978/g.199910 Transcript_85978/m.199910 type:complete len:576 (-) Transcript_85978:65-1792(-)
MATLVHAVKGALEAHPDVEGATEALAFIVECEGDLVKVLSLFGNDGEPVGGAPLPASCFNDFYKFTMMPVMRTVEQAHGDVRCTFSVNIRDADCRRRLHESATGAASPELYEEMRRRLSRLASRTFDRSTFERCVAEHSVPGWGGKTLDAVCGTSKEPRRLVQEFRAEPSCSTPQAPSSPGDVLLQLFVARDERLGEERVFVEATGPWHRVTWLETSMMQAVYESLFRDQKRREYGVEAHSGVWDDSSWFPLWLAQAFCRCVRSVEAATSAGLRGVLMTGRRTGSAALMILQALYIQCKCQKTSGMLGTSSVSARYMSLDAGVNPVLVPKCAGTHAHELPMVIGALLGEADDQVGMPMSQVVSHMLYFFTSMPQGDVRGAGRRVLMPILPDTLGSRAFMTVAKRLRVPLGLHKGAPVLSVVGTARQDSGSLEAFQKLMEECGFTGALMASEIEVPEDLVLAAKLGYKLFGAGGFMGDSEKAWDPSKNNLSMAVKVLRVYVNGEKCAFTPVKTGDTQDEGVIKEGKFEADAALSPEELQTAKERAQLLAAAKPKVDDASLQDIFDKTLRTFFGDSV